MKYEQFSLTASDGLALQVHLWEPESAPKAILQIAHGMAEHGARYAAYAQQFTDAGFVVMANDHRGHGLSINEQVPLGCFGSGGWAALVKDFAMLSDTVTARYPGLPLAVVGHSMGSHLVRDYLGDYSGRVAAVALSASFAKAGIERLPGLAVAKLERWRKGEQQPSALINALTFEQFNREFKPNISAFDWLSRDVAAVDKYIADPLCGFTCSTGLWVEFMQALGDLEKPQRGPRPDLPVLLLGGDADPSNKGRKGVEGLATQYRNLGLQNISQKIYAGGRHEIFNETNKDEVLADLIDWLCASLGLR